jgi:threonine synthase
MSARFRKAHALLHVSTRGEAPAVGFTDALLTGLARDGGLYVPEAWPALSRETIGGFAGRRYADVAKAVLGALVDDIPAADLDRVIEGSYDAFRHPAVCPLTQVGDNLFVLELFHGPTLAFKDVAMQLLGRLMDHVLRARGTRATIIGATSGDTGSAAADAFKGLDQVDVFILYPHGRVSEVQRRQMTGVDAPNVHTIALEGTFDDCQAIVKALFNHARFRDELQLSGVNSINWARIAAQVVYYFTAAVALGGPHRPVSFAVPTGNFGDILAAWVAKRMGLPVGRLMLATNANDILARTLATGTYEVRGVMPTTSPSMDIQVSSNFERLLFEAHGRDGAAVRRLMASLSQSRAFTIAPAPLARIRQDFSAQAVGEEAVVAEIAATWSEAGYLLDPHTAIGVRAARALLADEPRTPVVALATAHPAKFPDAVERATGLRPPLPPHLADLLDRPERFTVLPNEQSAVEAFIRERARAVRGAAA